MFIVFLRFADNKTQAAEYMDGHMQWLARGFDEGVFLLAGSIQPNQGGGILAHNTTQSELEARVNQDPFVTAQVVKAEIIEFAPTKVESRLEFLLN